MPCRIRLKRPLWTIIKSIGTKLSHETPATASRPYHISQRWQHARAVPQTSEIPATLAEDSIHENSGEIAKDLPVRKNERLARRARHVNYRQAADETARISWLQEKKADLQQDWPVILKLLLRSTPKGPLHHRRISQRARLPEGFTGFCRTSGQEFVLEIKLRTECDIEDPFSAFVLQSDSEDVGATNGFQHVTLYGTSEEIARASSLLPRYLYMVDKRWPQRAVPLRMTLERTSDPETNQNESLPPIRTVITSTFDRRPADVVIANRPSTWTVLAFASYVRDLTQARPRLMMRSRSRHSEATKTMIANELKSLYIGVVDLSSFISSEALDTTIKWFCQETRRLPVIRQIVARLEAGSRYKMTASNYEVLLEHAAKTLDVHNFLHLLRSMLAKNLTPTSRSFVLLHHLVCRREPDRAGVVFDTMVRQGVLTNFQAVREVAADCVRCAPNGIFDGNFHDVLGHFDQLFDPMKLAIKQRPVKIAVEDSRLWLTSAAANQLCYRLLLRNRPADAWQVISKLKATGGKPDRVTLRLLLTHAKARNSPALAVDTLARMKEDLGLITRQLDWKCWNILWRLAWHQKCFNMCRVIWRYACVEGHVDFGLQTAMSRSLLIHVPSQATCNKLEQTSPDDLKPDARIIGIVELFYGLVAKFSVGIADDHSTHYRETPGQKEGSKSTRELSKNESRVLSIVSELPAPLESGRQLRRTKCTALVGADMNETSVYPRLSFSEMLSKAWQQDKKWLTPSTRPYGEALRLRWADVKDLAPDERRLKVAATIQRCFENMLRDAVKVPVQRRIAGERYARNLKVVQEPEPEDELDGEELEWKIL